MQASPARNDSRDPLARFLVSILLILPCLSGCVVLVGAGAGYLVYHETTDGETITAIIEADVDELWQATDEALEIMVDVNETVTMNRADGLASATIDGTRVTVEVHAHDLNRTEVAVRAKGLIADDTDLARRVQNQILKQLRD